MFSTLTLAILTPELELLISIINVLSICIKVMRDASESTICYRYSLEEIPHAIHNYFELITEHITHSFLCLYPLQLPKCHSDPPLYKNFLSFLLFK
jgi:hypothetical protein